MSSTGKEWIYFPIKCPPDPVEMDNVYHDTWGVGVGWVGDSRECVECSTMALKRHPQSASSAWVLLMRQR